jgi:hypothetical protein
MNKTNPNRRPEWRQTSAAFNVRGPYCGQSSGARECIVTRQPARPPTVGRRLAANHDVRAAMKKLIDGGPHE